jgi:predicted TIM-barrel fold metal-dependent hydrolase
MKMIDTDIHNGFPAPDCVGKRLPRAFQEPYYTFPGFFGLGNPAGVLRADASGPNGEQPGTSLEQMQKQHLDAFEIEAGILIPDYSLSICIHPHADFAQAYARAYNEAMIEEWLTRDDRLFGSLLVAPQEPVKAAAMIREFGANKRFVSVIMASATRIPLGQRFFWPIYEAAEEMGMPVSVHPGTEGRGTANGFIAGPPSSYLEWHTNLPQNYMGQVVSLVLEGVFQKFPKLRFVAIEGGLAWIPGVLWRLDKNWKALRSLVPWVDRLPSEILVDHVRFTSQPIEEPKKKEHLDQLLDMIRADRTLMFSSDYPHCDNDGPTAVFRNLPEELKARIFRENALDTFPRLREALVP